MTLVAVYHQKEKNTFSIKIYYPTKLKRLFYEMIKQCFSTTKISNEGISSISSLSSFRNKVQNVFHEETIKNALYALLT